MKENSRRIYILLGISIALYSRPVRGAEKERIILPAPLFFVGTADGPPFRAETLQGILKSSEVESEARKVKIICNPVPDRSRQLKLMAQCLVIVQPSYQPFDAKLRSPSIPGSPEFAPPIDPSQKGAWMCKGKVIALESTEAELELPQAAIEKFHTNDWIRIVSATEFSTQVFDSIAQIASIECRFASTPLEIAEQRLQRIGNAIQKYVRTLGYYPPAVVNGPDGTPWHSWRVLILPYLGEAEHELFKLYDLSKPWNDERNLRVQAKMPEVFTAPGQDAASNPVTQFAAVLSDRGIFQPHGCILANQPTIDAFLKQPHSIRMPPNLVVFPKQVTDGSINTLAAGTVKGMSIPWTQPVDITLSETISSEGANSFSACYDDGDKRVALLLFAIGRVDRVPEGTPLNVLQALVTKDGIEPIFSYDLGASSATRKSPEYLGYNHKYRWIVEFEGNSADAVAILRRETTQ